MKHRFRVTWLLVLCLFVTSCAGKSYQRAALPWSSSASADAAPAGVVSVGSHVRVTMLTGEIILGKVVERKARGLVLLCSTENGEKSMAIGADEIIFIEKNYAEPSSTIPILAGVGAVIVFFSWLVSEMSGLEGN